MRLMCKEQRLHENNLKHDKDNKSASSVQTGSECKMQRCACEAAGLDISWDSLYWQLQGDDVVDNSAASKKLMSHLIMLNQVIKAHHSVKITIAVCLHC